MLLFNSSLMEIEHSLLFLQKILKVLERQEKSNPSKKT